MGVIQRSDAPAQHLLNSTQENSGALVHSGRSEDNQQHNSGSFSYAHDFSIHNPVIAEHVHVNKREGFNWIAGHAMPGVEYHSSAREPPPRCCEGTRTKFITMVERSLCDPDIQEKLLLLSGPAGVGKSAILQTLAERRAKSRALCASLFFPQSTSGDPLNSPSAFSPDSSRIWLTISYRLATMDSSYLDYVNEQVTHDPMLVQANMQQQFETLIVEPFGRRGLVSSSHLLPVFIDGLDQCQGHATQKQILQLIVNFVSEYPSAPLVWIITSRPDRHLSKIFEKLHLHSGVKADFIPVDSPDALADVKHFLRSEFNELQEEYETGDWPKTDDFNRVLTSVRGFFMIASAIVRFVGNPEVDDPMSQFDTVVSTVTPLPTHAPEHINPFVSVHEMYSGILQAVPKKSYHTAKRILGFYLLPQGFGSWTSQSTSFWALCNILGIEQGVAYPSLSKLLPLLSVPKLNHAIDTPIRFFHTSFAEFLTNRDASKEFWIDIKEVVDDLWQCHCRILRQTNTPNTPLPQPDEIKLAWPSSEPGESQDFRIEAWKNAQRVFFHQLLPCPADNCVLGIHDSKLSSKGSTKRIEVLREVNFDNLVDRYTLPEVPYRLLAFLDWLIEGDDDLVQHNLWKNLDLAEKGFDWVKEDGIAFRIDVERAPEGGALITFKSYTDLSLAAPAGIDPEELFSTGGPPESFGQLMSDLALHNDGFLTSVVVGHKAAGRSAILVYSEAEDITIYYLLPYDTVAP
ncbi:hypothetical protein P691DRAFT_812652 [Macrolepiota fuliginosa MF-IS2]|uniref:Nephrocystin 3-like N-terminal domain-containing protein n=1 Tax=Macrolepiota fuliginosa MF-IS2 TaxID=1400762 RepID=A0A9P5XFD8_9AGAR|nr:hypothetical protein P691DRAFT_812652 [Macrolepiota fuliginosa MF-IS2]